MVDFAHFDTSKLQLIHTISSSLYMTEKELSFFFISERSESDGHVETLNVIALQM